MLTKISVMILLWIVLGFCMLMGTTIVTAVKIYKLDPKNDHIFDDAEDIMVPRVIRDIMEKMDKRSSVASYIEMSIEWPKTLALIRPIYKKTYETLKDEYDRGVRTRAS